MGFEVIPAIDLRGGRCVRLAQGDFTREIWSEDPIDVAARWSIQGASRLHIVDLDGAAAGKPMNLETLRRVRAVTGVPIQYAGGLRSDEAVAEAFEAGADQVVVGTALVSRPDWVAELCSRFGARVLAGIDARQNKVAVQGWLEESKFETAELVERANGLGLHRVIVTDIERDGMLGGPNLEALQHVIERAKFEVIASGGMSSVDDLIAARDAGAAGAIVGQALYTGRIQLEDALVRLSSTNTRRDG